MEFILAIIEFVVAWIFISIKECSGNGNDGSTFVSLIQNFDVKKENRKQKD